MNDSLKELLAEWKKWREGKNKGRDYVVTAFELFLDDLSKEKTPLLELLKNYDGFEMARTREKIRNPLTK